MFLETHEKSCKIIWLCDKHWLNRNSWWTFASRLPNPQIKKSDSCHQVSGVTAFQHLCNWIPLLAILTKLWIANHKSWHPSPQSNGEITWDRATNQIYFHPSMSVKFHPKEDLGVDWPWLEEVSKKAGVGLKKLEEGGTRFQKKRRQLISIILCCNASVLLTTQGSSSWWLDTIPSEVSGSLSITKMCSLLKLQGNIGCECSTIIDLEPVELHYHSLDSRSDLHDLLIHAMLR